MSLYFGSGTGEMSSRSKSRSKMDQMVETYNRACVRCSLADVRSVFTHAHVCARASMEGEAVSIVGGVSLSSHSRRGGQARRFVNGERELAIRRAAPQLVGGCARAREAALIPRLRGRRTKGFTEASARWMTCRKPKRRPVHMWWPPPNESIWPLFAPCSTVRDDHVSASAPPGAKRSGRNASGSLQCAGSLLAAGMQTMTTSPLGMVKAPTARSTSALRMSRMSGG
mmetsp:Transcript_34669/g.76252  ORF Transcript_34669/g.76252 Transcript_34669/m.76252 type:complete len:227 (-) Transcript_34669:1092-1772(-)